jgi:hypothetical protein
MIIPEFMRFYGVTAEKALSDYAVRFFSLANSMYRLQAREDLMLITVMSSALSGGSEAQTVIDELKKKEKGLHGILEEVRIIKGK